MGGPGSGRRPKIFVTMPSRVVKAYSSDAELLITSEIIKILEHPDPATLPEPKGGAARVAWHIFQDSISSSNTAAGSRKEMLDRVEGSKMQAVRADDRESRLNWDLSRYSDEELTEMEKNAYRLNELFQKALHHMEESKQLVGVKQ